MTIFGCRPPEDMIPVMSLSEAVFTVLIEHAAKFVMRFDTAVAVLGACEYGAVYCWRPCWAKHPGVVLAIPDLMVAQLAANNLADVSPMRLERGDGRSVHLYRTREHT